MFFESLDKRAQRQELSHAANIFKSDRYGSFRFAEALNFFRLGGLRRLILGSGGAAARSGWLVFENFKNTIDGRARMFKLRSNPILDEGKKHFEIPVLYVELLKIPPRGMMNIK